MGVFAFSGLGVKTEQDPERFQVRFQLWDPKTLPGFSLSLSFFLSFSPSQKEWIGERKKKGKVSETSLPGGTWNL